MKRILLSAYACQPGKGSEEGGGWNWAAGLAGKGYEVHCLTRSVNREAIEAYPLPPNLIFYYVPMPMGSERLFHMPGPFIYIHYMSWQWLAYKRARQLHKKINFDVAHHVSWGSLQMGSFLYKLNIPFIFGPAGGGQHAPEAFKQYFLGFWQSELQRKKVSDLMVKYNPGCKNMVRDAHAVLVSNPDTMALAKSIGARNCYFSFDYALAESFFPKEFKAKSPKIGQLNLLWVGRFMPRKGLLLVLDVMNQLKSYPQIKLTVVGYGEMQEIIEQRISDYGLEHTVHLTGRVAHEEVRAYYASHDVFFFTSLRDSNGVQLMEAMAFGMPIVTLNLHGQAILVNDYTGIRCTVASPEVAINELKAALLDLYNDPAKVTRMSEAAIKFARTQTWPEKITGIVDDYYPHSA